MSSASTLSSHSRSASPESVRSTVHETGPAPGLDDTENTLRMNEQDIQNTAKFVREFVTMSLIPWMEKCVVDWNENVDVFYSS
jgi:trafficking protein particle complex subunit 8